MMSAQNPLLKPEQFVYWLQGFCEINGASPTEEQWTIIKEHLALCFEKVTKVQQRATEIPFTLPKDYDYAKKFIPEPFDKGTWPPGPIAIC